MNTYLKAQLALAQQTDFLETVDKLAGSFTDEMQEQVQALFSMAWMMGYMEGQKDD